MASPWTTEYAHEASNYLVDNAELVRDLFLALEALDDQPVRGEFTATHDLQIAVIEGHAVAFRRNFSRQVVRVAAIKPQQ